MSLLMRRSSPVPQVTTLVHPVELPPARNIPPVAGVVRQDGSGQVCHIRRCKTKSSLGRGLVEATAKGCPDSRNRGAPAEDSSPYCLVCGGIEFHDGGI